MTQKNKFSIESDVDFESVWTDLKNIYKSRLNKRPTSDGRINESDFIRWTHQINVTNEILFERISIRLAREFYARESDFTFCDAVVNDLFGLYIQFQCKSDLFWQVYIAFDAGEFYHEGKTSENPSELYTRPLIEKIVKSIFSKN